MSRAHIAQPRNGVDAVKPDAVYTVVPTDERSSSEKSTTIPTSWWYRITLDTWIPEVIAISISAAATIAIGAILRYYSGKSSPELPWGITLNAIVSILATISRSMLVYTVSMSIGQLKWCWYYRKKRSVMDIQTLDTASRGPLGSVVLLINLRARPLATIGAIITIVALAFDPAVQQILQYPTRTIERGGVTPQVVRATAFMPGDVESIAGRYEDWLNAINAGIWSPAERFDRQLDCPTGQCTWPSYRSVGWCSKCQDATPYANIANCTLSGGAFDPDRFNDTNACQITFGHGNTFRLTKRDYDIPIPGQTVIWPQAVPSLNDPPRRRQASSNRSSMTVEAIWPLMSLGDNRHTRDYFDSDTYVGVVNPVLSLAYAATQPCDERSEQALCITSAQECIISLCETERESSVANGSSKTVVTNTNFGAVSGWFDRLPGGDPHFQGYCWQPDQNTQDFFNRTWEQRPTANPVTLTFCPEGFDTTTGGETGNGVAFAHALIKQLEGNKTVVLDGDGSVPFTTSEYGDTSTDSMLYILANRLPEILESVAASLTEMGLQDANYTETVNGTVWVSETYVSVTWPWLILPILLVLGSILLLIVAAAHSHRSKLRLWKSSILPLLYRSLDQGLLDEQPVLRDVGAMAMAADQAKVRLVSDTHQDRTVLTAQLYRRYGRFGANEL